MWKQRFNLILWLVFFVELLIVMTLCLVKYNSYSSEHNIMSVEPIQTSEMIELEVLPEITELCAEADNLVMEEPVEELVSLGEFTLTAYCKENYPHICNNGDSSVTATGTTPTPGRTIAVDPSVIPYGTEVVINGNTYIAEDTGGAINDKKIDICFATHDEALQFGRQSAEVFIVKEGIK